MNKFTPKNYILSVFFICVLLCIIWFLYSKKKLSVPNLKQFTQKSKKLVLYYTDSCGFCNRFKPTWEKIENDQKAIGVNASKVDCKKYENICNAAGIDEYPTIHLHVGDSKIKYDGDFTYDDVVKFINSN